VIVVSTRSKINVYDGSNTYSIYRHSDGYPEGIVNDIRVYMRNYHDPYGSIHGPITSGRNTAMASASEVP